MKVTFELSADDVARFRAAMVAARATVRSADENEIIDCAKHALDGMRLGDAPSYVRERIAEVQRMIAMLEDDAWALPAALRTEVLGALVYFSDPDDMIPDGLPVIGLLDDAIMLELLLREERDLLDAHRKFCEFRRSLGPLADEPGGRTATRARITGERQRLMQKLKEKRKIY